MYLHLLPFTEPCDGCDGFTEVMTSSQKHYMTLWLDTAEPGDRVYCTRCDCRGTVELGLIHGKYVDWGEDVCEQCEASLTRKLEALTQRIREQLGCESVVITREK